MVTVEARIQKAKFYSMDFQKSFCKIAKNVVTYEYDPKKQTLRCVFGLQTEADNFSANMTPWGK